jgi:BirA family biotin operon repressor/biotin-[acetyl-CoA-carboxylase] ligase
LEERRLDRLLVPGHFITRIRIEETLESTQRSLLERASLGKADLGDLLVTERQTAGMGRRGRAWCSVPYRSLTFSFLCPNYFPRNPGNITIGTALAAATAVEREAALPVRIKWPNDLYTGGGKLGGILAQPVDASREKGLAVGVGINVNAAPDPKISHAGAVPVCLSELKGAHLDRTRLLAGLLNEIHTVMRRFALGEQQFLAQGLRRRSLILGRRARFAWNNVIYEGRVLDHTDDLGILMAVEEKQIVLPGETADLLDFES